MGKSRGKKKKSGATQNQGQSQVAGGDKQFPHVANAAVNLDSSVFLKRAHELKEEGNKMFQNKDYMGALQQYEDALKITPKWHPDRAVFHSNRAACLMQMKPINFDAVISECTSALQVQPQYVRALLRRARAYEAIGKCELAMQDVQSMLTAYPNNQDALDIAGRLRMVLGPRQEVQQDIQSRPSPAALGASAVRGVPIAGLGPGLPTRPVPKKPVSSVSGPTVTSNKSEKLYPVPPIENGSEMKPQFPEVVLKPSIGSSSICNATSKEKQKEWSPRASDVLPLRGQAADSIRWRPLKLVYEHDIRLARMPLNCTFKDLREVVAKRFPMSKAVLIKYKDDDGDLVTITCSSELRLAETSADKLILNDADTNKGESVGMLRLHIVEVSPEQEPPLLKEDEEVPLEGEMKKCDDNVLLSSVADSSIEADTVIDHNEKVAEKDKNGGENGPDFKEVEMDDWLFEFAQLFRSHVGIDPDAQVDLHELGMELCSEALEETVTGEEAQNLFDKAATKFQEIAALAFFNWGNVHMCAARKKIPIDESDAKEIVAAQLQKAYDWVKEKYSLASKKYEEALSVKPDFYEGLLALGQQQFEMAKLHWSFVLAKKEDLSKWDPTETITLFDSAEEKIKSATEIWETQEEQRINELKDPNANKKDEVLKRRKRRSAGADRDFSDIGGEVGISPEEAAEQAAVMRSQIHLFWGNMLFERSQVESKLGLPGWKKNLDTAVERFKLAGASEDDISLLLKNHCCNEQVAATEKKAESLIANVVENGDN